MTWTTCARCIYGAGKYCPDGMPLPHYIRHSCMHLVLKEQRAPDAHPWHEHGGADLPRSHKACQSWIASVWAEDAEKGLDRLMRDRKEQQP